MSKTHIKIKTAGGIQLDLMQKNLIHKLPLIHITKAIQLATRWCLCENDFYLSFPFINMHGKLEKGTQTYILWIWMIASSFKTPCKRLEPSELYNITSLRWGRGRLLQWTALTPPFMKWALRKSQNWGSWHLKCEIWRSLCKVLRTMPNKCDARA